LVYESKVQIPEILKALNDKFLYGNWVDTDYKSAPAGGISHGLVVHLIAILFDMKVKIIITIFVFNVVLISASFSQCVSVELSVNWKKGFDVFQKDSMVCFPVLSITYRNNSDVNIYFPKASDSRNELPMLIKGSLVQYPIEEYLNPDYLKRAKLHGDYTNKKYKVLIGGSPLFLKSWLVEKDTLNKDTLNTEYEDEIDIINDELANIYEYMHQLNSNTLSDSIGMTKQYFSITDITPDKIIGEFKNRFIFLKPEESITDIYNLYGFSLLKGTYTFHVDPNSIKGEVLTPVWDNQSNYLEVKTALPLKVGKYILYTEPIRSNKIILEF
jgi:hypothetical protein